MSRLLGDLLQFPCLLPESHGVVAELGEALAERELESKLGLVIVDRVPNDPALILTLMKPKGRSPSPGNRPLTW